MPPIYNPFDWYWRKKDGTVFSSRREREFPADDPEYQDWLAKGHTPKQYPVDNYGKENRDWMLAILEPWSLRIYPLTEAEEIEASQRLQDQAGSGRVLVEPPTMDVPENLHDRKAVERYRVHLRMRPMLRQPD